MSMAEKGPQAGRRPRRRAGIFDLRVLIGVLLGIYGVVLLLMGWFGTSEEELARADGVNVNTWTGVGLVAASVVFMLWARLRPVLVPVDHTAEEHRPEQPGH